MKRNCKRGISLLLSVCLVLGIFASSGLNLVRAADAEPKVETVVSNKNLIENGTFDAYKDIVAYQLDTKNLPAPWTASGSTGGWKASVTNEKATDGEYAFKLENEAAQKTIGLNATFAIPEVTEDTNLYVSCDLYVTGDPTGVKLTYTLNDGDTKVNAGTLAMTYGTEDKPGNAVTGEWVTIKGSKGAKGTDSIVFKITATTAVTKVYLDNIKVWNKDNPDVNLLEKENASFDDGLETFEKNVIEANALFPNAEGWTEKTQSTIMADETGKNAAMHVVGAGGWGNEYKVDLEPGATYKVNFKYKASVAMKFYLNELDAEGANVMIDKVVNAETGETNSVKLQQINDLDAAADWTDAEITFKALTDSTEFALIYPFIQKTAVAEDGGKVEAWFDNFVLTKVCDAHTFGDAVVTGEGNCASPVVSVKTCSNCGATETTTTTYPHDFVKGACSVCGTPCEHNAPAGYCLICKDEIPAEVIDYEQIANGTFENGAGEITSYPVNEDWQIAPWYFSGDPKAEGISVKVTDAWSSEGDWSVLISDSSQTEAVSINYAIDLTPGANTEVYISADVAEALGNVSMQAEFRENGVTIKDENGNSTTVGTAYFKKKGTGTVEETGAVPANADQMIVKITTRKSEEAALAMAYVDNLVCKLDGSENLLENASFEVLPVGSEPVVTTGTPAISYPAGSSTKEGWTGFATTEYEDTATNTTYTNTSEVAWETETNAALHISKQIPAAAKKALSVSYYLYDLEAGATYTLKFRAKADGNSAPKVYISQMNGNAFVTDTSYLSLGDSDNVAVTTSEWGDYEATFTLQNVTFTRVRIMVNMGSGVVTDAWFDDFSLVKVCDHKWENPVVSEADCVNAATRTVTCACGAIGVTELNPCTGEHTWVEADCTILKHCSVPGCGATEGEALGHDYSNGDGVCARCQHVCGHTYVDEEGNSTNGICFLCGVACTHTYADDQDTDCDVCGFVREVAPAIPSDPNLVFYGNPALCFQDYIGMNILVKNSVASKYVDFYVEAVQVAPDGTITRTVCEEVPSGKTYTIINHPVMAWSMTEEVTLTLYGKTAEGVIWQGNSVTASVESLAQAMLERDHANAEKVLNCRILVDMLNYGAALQVNQNHYADSLPSAGAYANMGTDTTPELSAITTTTGSGKAIYGPGFSTLDKIVIQATFKAADMEGKTVKIFADGVEVDAALISYVDSGIYRGACLSIKAYEMRTTYTFALYDNVTGAVVSKVITTSVEALCLKNINANTNVDLCKAVMCYGDAVEAYAKQNAK